MGYLLFPIFFGVVCTLGSLRGIDHYTLSDLPWGASSIQFKGDPYTDHIPAFDYLFSQERGLKFIEFGLGKSTQFFLDHCLQVKSVEILLPEKEPAYFDQFKAQLDHYPHWEPSLYIGSVHFSFADQMSLKRKNPGFYNGAYLLELKDLFDQLFSGDVYDIAFVDPGVHFRGDMINELFGRVKIITAHDTNHSHLVWGLERVGTPFDYVRIDYSQGCGTTFWIHKSHRQLIKQLIPFYEEQKSRKLRIFFPSLHGQLTEAFSRLCNHLGHTLLLPGNSFKRDSPNQGPKVFFHDCEDIPDRFEDVELIENDEILDNPPDVLFVLCAEIEEEIHTIYRKIKAKWPEKEVKIAYQSLTENVSFQKVKNLLVQDAKTLFQYDLNSLQYAFWIPWSDWKGELQFKKTHSKGPIHSFLGYHYTFEDFHEAAVVYEDFISRYEKESEGNIFHLEEWIPYTEVLNKMGQSIATLHIKNREGLGLTILQSLGLGRPVILKRSFAKGKRLMQWCIEGETALFFDSYEEFKEIIDRLRKDPVYVVSLQERCAKQVRRLINNEREAQVFEHFIQNLF